MINPSTEVFSVVKKIPKGFVTTYGRLGKLALIHPRVIGMILHTNKDPKSIPCHRVVNGRGRLADNYAFGGWRAQRKKLLAEGLKFKNQKTVDLAKNVWEPKS